MRLKEKVTIVTGAGRGIGRATALRFAEEGSKVVVVYLDLDEAQSVADEIVAMGGESLAAKVDVSNRSSVNAMVQATLDHFDGHRRDRQ